MPGERSKAHARGQGVGAAVPSMSPHTYHSSSRSRAAWLAIWRAGKRRRPRTRSTRTKNKRT